MKRERGDGARERAGATPRKRAAATTGERAAARTRKRAAAKPRKLLKVCYIHPGGDNTPAPADHVAELATRERPDNLRVFLKGFKTLIHARECLVFQANP